MTLKNTVLILSTAMLMMGCVSSSPKGSTTDLDAARDNYIDLGIGYLSTGNNSQARFNLLKAIDIDPRSAKANEAIALLYESEGENDLADSHYRKSISLDKNFTQARYNYARFLLRNGRAGESARLYESVTEDVNYRLRGQAFLGLGLAREQEGDLEAAKRAYARAYQRDQSLSLALLELADLAVLEKDYVSAKELLDRFEGQSVATPRSLKLGADLAPYFNDTDGLASYSMALKNMFPDSREAREYILSEQE